MNLWIWHTTTTSSLEPGAVQINEAADGIPVYLPFSENNSYAESHNVPTRRICPCVTSRKEVAIKILFHLVFFFACYTTREEYGDRDSKNSATVTLNELTFLATRLTRLIGIRLDGRDTARARVTKRSTVPTNGQRIIWMGLLGRSNGAAHTHTPKSKPSGILLHTAHRRQNAAGMAKCLPFGRVNAVQCAANYCHFDLLGAVVGRLL